MVAYTTVSSKNRGVVGFAPFDMASPGVLPVTIQPLAVCIHGWTNLDGCTLDKLLPVLRFN